ncbi:MAG TPA: hypothetical protein VK042_01890 [Atopostipes sp.]|nr:hypothetical protein [Atopostipes sp.]
MGVNTEEQVYEVMYKDLKEGYAVLHGEYDRLKNHCDQLKQENDELAVAYKNAQNEIRLLKNGG